MEQPIKVYAPNTKQGAIGGGWTFLRNFRKGMAGKVQLVNRWEDCDIFFVTGITITDKDEIHQAHKAGKRIVLRVDNVPRKSRNRRSSPHERLKEFAGMANVVIYQSEWAKKYCFPLCGDGTVIYNGVDTSIFYPSEVPQEDKLPRYLYAYHGHNEQKGFWAAHYIFQMEWRKNNAADFTFIYDFGRDLQELQNANFDFWQGEKFQHLDRVDDPKAFADILRQHKYLIYPAICDASPNMVLEARACGLEVIGAAPAEMSGTAELLDPELDISLERMCDEYFGVFQLVMTT